MEPLRDAHRLLLRIHLAEGNASEVIRQFGLCPRLFREQVELEPTPQLADLVAKASLATPTRRGRDGFAGAAT